PSTDIEPGFLRRFVASDEELEASQLRLGSEQRGVTAATACGRGSIVELYGRLCAVQHIPGSALSSPAVEAELFDGSGSVTLVWLGRCVIGGILAGAQLRVHGRVALREGRRVIFNPEYTLEAGEL
ncbi:MAG: OB-fold nucleic acid binding domain-containing protein, partial [Mycobacteriales bacterium]